MLSKLTEILNLKLLVAFIAGLTVVLIGYVLESSYFYSYSFKQNIEVVWPNENVNLYENQVLILDLINPEYQPEQIIVAWELEDGLVTGEMSHVGGSQYQAEVNVANWDWRKDNKYKLSFTVKTLDGLELNKTSVFVYSGNEELVNPLPLENIEPENTIVANLAENNTASVSNAVAPKVESVAVNKPTSINNEFRIEWVKSAVESNQKFIYHTSGYNSDKIIAFWNTEGGHKNLLFKKEGENTFTASINVFGWRWLGKGPYKINFMIADKDSAKELASQSFVMTWTGEPGNSEIEVKKTGETIIKSATPVAPVIPAKPIVTVPKPTEVVPVVKPPVNASTNYLVSSRLYKPSKPAVENALAATSDARAVEALKYILSQPNSIWLNGDGYDSDEYIKSVLVQAESQNQVPAFVLYNIPNRDCGSHSSGGTASINGYKVWIDRIAKNLNQAEAILIIEPDALAMLNCLKEEDRAGRIEMLKYAVDKLTASGDNVMVYLDAGHPYWVDINEMSNRLKLAGVEKARGFALNVSNYVSTEDNITYGNLISNILGGKKFVIDSSRSGNSVAPTREWCNPSGRALGESPTLTNGSRGNLDAILWIKFPGESDGSCNGGPSAGQWWTNYAVDLYFNR